MVLGVIPSVTFLLFGQGTRLLQIFPDVGEDYARFDSKMVFEEVGDFLPAICETFALFLGIVKMVIAALGLHQSLLDLQVLLVKLIASMDIFQTLGA